MNSKVVVHELREGKLKRTPTHSNCIMQYVQQQPQQQQKNTSKWKRKKSNDVETATYMFTYIVHTILHIGSMQNDM